MRSSLPDARGLSGAKMPAAAWSAADRDPRVEASYAAPAAIAVTFAMAAVMSALRGHVDPVAGLVVMAVVVAVTGWFGSWTATAVTAGVGWLMLNGFVEDRYGVLRWHGRTDLVLLGVLMGCGVVVAWLREAQIRRRRRAVAMGMDAELDDMARPSHHPSGERHD